MVGTFGGILISVLAVTFGILILIFVLVPLFKGIAWTIGSLFKAIGWLFTHIFEYIGGTIGDVIRLIGGVIACLALMLLVPLNIVIGRWSAAGHFAEAVKRECGIGSACLYRIVIRRPLKLVMLHGLLEGLEQRVPEAMYGAPGSDTPSRRVGQFDGYTITGSLRAGGSGAKLYIAQPDHNKRRKFRNMPEHVVIKCFALTEGSSLPQIVRESRALECAKQLGHVLDHGMDEHRFFYVMPYHPGDHLGIITRQMHGECGGRGLDQKRLGLAMSYVGDLLSTLSAYHKGGLWHKDVKPENVIVHDGRAHLVDLGLVTPLRSAMTLTTHGTEYFRDPEMVRQALRGVKVHQVDGAKFDIYAAGAVLYFMIENTFPAHGGLSRFVTPSPEALRWIVRRAMTEYNQRYSTAELMLADLAHVMRSGDAYAVRPADLPSMRGEGFVPFENAPEVEVIAAAASPIPPREFAGVGDGPFGVGQTFVGQSAAPAATVSKPRIRVTNWWTGEYRAEQAADAPAGGHAKFDDDARAFRDHAFAFRQQAADFGRQARAGAISARKAAREQIKAARHRAREIRSRAAAHRHRVAPGVRTSGWAIAIGALSVLFLTGIIALSLLASAASPRLSRLTGWAREDRPGKPLVYVIDYPDANDPRLQQHLQKSLAKQRDKGYDVINIEGDGHKVKLLDLVRNWHGGQDKDDDKALEDFFEERNVYGVLYVKPVEGKNRVIKDLDTTLIYSIRPGAEERRRDQAPPVPAAPALPYLLINDHPAKTDLQVAASIEKTLKSYRDRGWVIQTNDDAEVKVRKVLPTGPFDSKAILPRMFHAAMTEGKFGGVLRIGIKPGEQPPHERIDITRIDVDPNAIAAPEDTSSSVVAQPQEPAQASPVGSS